MSLSWRARKQLAVILVILLPILVVSGFFIITSLVSSEPSCRDNVQNQGELGVDCGGPCLPCDLKNPKDITVFWTRAVAVEKDTFDVVARIRNPNNFLASDKVEYEFLLFDEFGSVASSSGRTFILPQETVHVIETNLKTSRNPLKVKFRIKSVKWEIAEEFLPRFTVEKKEYKIEDVGGIRRGVVNAVIFNRSPFDFKKATIGFILLDRQGNLIGANRVGVENFVSGTRKNIKAFWPGEIPGEISQIIVEPRVNILEQDTILQP